MIDIQWEVLLYQQTGQLSNWNCCYNKQDNYPMGSVVISTSHLKNICQLPAKTFLQMLIVLYAKK